MRNLEEYLKELERSKKEKPEQVKDALEIYIGLWRKAISKGVVAPDDEIEKALAKIDESGGLYKASED